jgi:hypothetical protein
MTHFGFLILDLRLADLASAFALLIQNRHLKSKITNWREELIRNRRANHG